MDINTSRNFLDNSHINTINIKIKLHFSYLLIVIFIAIGSSSFAQSADLRTNELNEWANIKIKKKINSDFQIFIAPQIRFEQKIIKKYLFETGGSYELNKHFDVGFGYRYSFEEKKKNDENVHRFDLDISASTKFHRFKPELRIQFNTEKDVLETERFNTLRYKTSLDYDPKKSILKPFIVGELFQNLNENELEKFRIGAGLEFKINKHNSIDIAYLLDYNFTKERNIHIISIGYDFDF